MITTALKIGAGIAIFAVLLTLASYLTMVYPVGVGQSYAFFIDQILVFNFILPVEAIINVLWLGTTMELAFITIKGALFLFNKIFKGT